MPSSEPTPVARREIPADAVVLSRAAQVRVGPLTIEPALRRVVRDDGQEAFLQPRVMQVLVALVRADGKILSRDDLMAQCWSGMVVGEDSLNRVMVRLRQLSEGPGAGVFRVDTITKVGYRFVRIDQPTGEPNLEPRGRPASESAGAGGGASARTAQPAATPPRADKPWIAVTPFANQSNDSDQNYFAEGMAEEITTALYHYPDLIVVGVGAGQEGQSGVGRTAAGLGVRYLLEGSVRKAGDRVRVTVRLVDAIDNLPVWSNRFDGALADTFALQDDVAHAVAAEVVSNVGVAEERRAASRPTTDMTAYDLYLRARSVLRGNERGAARKAIALLEQAISLDPNYGRALALAAFAHSLAIAGAHADLDTSRRAALDLMGRALKLARDDPEALAYAVLAAYSVEADISVAARMVERALEHYPGVSMLWHASGWANLRLGRPDVAQARFEEAIRLDPTDTYLPLNQMGLGQALVRQERYEEAVPTLADALRLAPLTPTAAVYLAFALSRLGLQAKAKEVLDPYKRSVITAFLQRVEGGRSPVQSEVMGLLETES